jgi:hypothetical protein
MVFSQILYHGPEQQRWNGQIMSGPLSASQFPAQSLKRRDVGVVAVHVSQLAAQLRERILIHTAVLYQALVRPLAKLIEVPASLSHANNRNVQMSALYHGLKRRENLLVCQVTCGTKEN